MRIVYFGTPSAAVPPLRALVGAGHDIALVVSQPDRRRGRRGGELVASAVKQCAMQLELPVVTPERSSEVVDEVTALDAELGVVVAFGQLLPPALLVATQRGFVNMHFSLLPRWRGAAPVERAILAGDSHTGVAIMEVEADLDTGGIYAQRRLAIRDDETAGELRDRLVECGTELLIAELALPRAHEPLRQAGEVSYARKLMVEEFRLDPVRDAIALSRTVRAGNPKPGAWCIVRGRRLKVMQARAVADIGEPVGVVTRDGILSCADGALAMLEVQPEGKRSMTGAAWIAGLQGIVAIDDPVDDARDSAGA